MVDREHREKIIRRALMLGFTATDIPREGSTYTPWQKEDPWRKWTFTHEGKPYGTYNSVDGSAWDFLRVTGNETLAEEYRAEEDRDYQS